MSGCFLDRFAERILRVRRAAVATAGPFRLGMSGRMSEAEVGWVREFPHCKRRRGSNTEDLRFLLFLGSLHRR